MSVVMRSTNAICQSIVMEKVVTAQWMCSEKMVHRVGTQKRDCHPVSEQCTYGIHIYFFYNTNCIKINFFFK